MTGNVEVMNIVTHSGVIQSSTTYKRLITGFQTRSSEVPLVRNVAATVTSWSSAARARVGMADKCLIS